MQWWGIGRARRSSSCSGRSRIGLAGLSQVVAGSTLTLWECMAERTRGTVMLRPPSSRTVQPCIAHVMHVSAPESRGSDSDLRQEQSRHIEGGCRLTTEQYTNALMLLCCAIRECMRSTAASLNSSVGEDRLRAPERLGYQAGGGADGGYVGGACQDQRPGHHLQRILRAGHVGAKPTDNHATAERVRWGSLAFEAALLMAKHTK